MVRSLRRLAVAAGAALVAAAAGAQISPGPLSRPHAELEGSRNCLECHSKGQGVDRAKCLSCHKILGDRISRGLGLHAQPGYEGCHTCHIEHHGADYELVWWGDAGLAAFDHGLTGWELEGAHDRVECRSCHTAANIGQPGPMRTARKNLDRSYLGLKSECRSCHEDEHRGQFEGRDCLSCHALDAFKPASGFDHSTAEFILTGGHANVACADCHREESALDGATFSRFRPIAHQQCSSCHRDPHRGELGDQCSSCHATASWYTTPGFDHSATRYPLTGRHRQVACADCHREGRGELRFRGLAFGECSDCHSDPHEARLGLQCASCHATSGWETVRAGAFDHGQTEFALEGAHTSVDCAACHLPGRPLRISDFGRCASCHEDSHLGQFANRADGGECASCHTVASFVPTTFAVADHLTGRFPLEGLHQGVTCVECHVETSFRRRTDGEIVVARKFAFQRLACVECHTDPHEGTTDPWLTRAGLVDAGCAACHGEAGWKESVFDHSTTAFALKGAHREASCGKCHAAEVDVVVETADRLPLRLGGLDAECATCHEDPHRGQFSDRPGGCGSCHTAEKWATLDFDHATTAFPLTGAHAPAACVSCHLPEGPGGAVRYRPLPVTCEGCHSG